MRPRFGFTLSPDALANYYCSGTVSYLGLDVGGAITIALTGATKVHKICSMTNQESYTIAPVACKAIYGALLTAKSLDKSIRLYYYDRYTCEPIPDWGVVPETYFVEGPY
jgi:hypothetical protein